MALPRDGTDDAQESTRRQNRKKAKADQRHCLQTTAGEVSVCWFNCLVQARHLLLNLSADAADKPIRKWRHLAQNDHRPGFYLPIGLLQWRERNIGLLHGLSLMSAREYSGSSSP